MSDLSDSTEPDVSPLAQSLLYANDKCRNHLAELEEAAKALGHESADDGSKTCAINARH